MTLCEAFLVTTEQSEGTPIKEVQFEKKDRISHKFNVLLEFKSK